MPLPDRSANRPGFATIEVSRCTGRHATNLLTQTYEQREYCVQYRETDYNFICRLLEEEGIWWCFEQSRDSHVLVLADSTTAYRPIDEEAALPYKPPSGMNVVAEHIHRFRLGHSVRPGAARLNDFNFENPALRLEAKSEPGRDTGLEFYDYPGEYTSQSHGDRLAGLRAEEFESSRVHGVGQSNSHRLAPARIFELTGHPTELLNRGYLVTAVTHQGKQATRRSSTGTNGRSGILGSDTHRALQAARRNADPAIRDLAEALLTITMRLGAGDETAHRELTHWLYHAGQVTQHIPSVASATGRNPLEALSLPNLIEDAQKECNTGVPGTGGK